MLKVLVQICGNGLLNVGWLHSPKNFILNVIATTTDLRQIVLKRKGKSVVQFSAEKC